MDKLALLYETNAIVGSNAVRPQLMRDIMYYHEQNNQNKLDTLLESITDAEMEYLIDRGIVQELFGRSAPNMRGGMMQSAKDKVAGKFGGQESGMRNKLVEVYKQVWAEWINYSKQLTQYAAQQKGLGGNVDKRANMATPDNLVTFLQSIGFGDKVITQISNEFRFHKKDETGAKMDYDTQNGLNKEEVGKILYRALQLQYQGTVQQPKYQSSFKLPKSL